MKMEVYKIILFCLMPTLNCMQHGSSQELGDTITDFGYDLYQTLATLHKGSNIVLSPYSISTALAMTYLGAKKDTANQMYKAMHMSDLNNNTNIHQAYQQITNQLTTANKEVIFNTANKIFGQKKFKFLQSFLNGLDIFYKAPLMQLDFVKDPAGSRDFINNWVAKETHQKIQDLLPPGSVDLSTVLVIANAVYFQGTWVYRFNASKTTTETFSTQDGQQMDVDMMNAVITLNWTRIDSLDAQMVEVPYKSGAQNRTAMYIVLPDKPDGIQKLDQGLHRDVINDAIKSMQRSLLNISLPRFHLTEHYDLTEALSLLGMSDLFKPLADLSGMDGCHDLWVSSLQHKALINVTEAGTVAAAASGSVVHHHGPSPPPQPIIFKADHPFVFFIRDNLTGTNLFLGRMVCVTGKEKCQ